MAKKIAYQYLTKRRLISAARTGMKIASAETMSVMGCNVIAEGGWVVKKFANGTVKKLSRIPKSKGAKKTAIVLD
jgi:hypothetical protein